MIEAAAAAAPTATSSDWLSMLSISLSMSVHIWCGVRCVGLARVIVYYRLYRLCDPREQFMICRTPNRYFFRRATFFCHICNAKSLQTFAPDRAIIVESESFQTFFATFCSHKERT